MPRTRKTVDDRIGFLNGKRRDIDKKIGTLRTRQNGERRKLDTRRKLILGGAVMAHAKLDAEFAKALRVALHKAVAPRDKAIVGDLMEPSG